jgi:hypothetical protein
MEPISEQARLYDSIFKQQMLKAATCEQLAAGGGQQGALSVEPYELHPPLSQADIASGTGRQLQNIYQN